MELLPPVRVYLFLQSPEALLPSPCPLPLALPTHEVIVTHLGPLVRL